MESRFFTDFHTCKTCLIKDTCENSTVRPKENEDNQIRPCKYCTRRCDDYSNNERMDNWNCANIHCMFEVKEGETEL